MLSRREVAEAGKIGSWSVAFSPLHVRRMQESPAGATTAQRFEGVILHVDMRIGCDHVEVDARIASLISSGFSAGKAEVRCDDEMIRKET